MQSFLTITDLSKEFGKKIIFNGVNLEVKQGDIFGLVGNNGAGKTTLLRIICGLLKETSGKVEFAKEHARIGVLIENPGLYTDMSAYENLKAKTLCLGYRCEKEELYRLIDLVGLTDAGKKSVRKYSMGMKQRLGLALALVGNPDLLVLDEPINGLDPEGIHDFRNILLKINQEQKTTMIISSHILDELEKIATTFCFLHDHRVVKQISSEDMAKERGDTPIDEYYLSVLLNGKKTD